VHCNGLIDIALSRVLFRWREQPISCSVSLDCDRQQNPWPPTFNTRRRPSWILDLGRGNPTLFSTIRFFYQSYTLAGPKACPSLGPRKSSPNLPSTLLTEAPPRCAGCACLGSLLAYLGGGGGGGGGCSNLTTLDLRRVPSDRISVTPLLDFFGPAPVPCSTKLRCALIAISLRHSPLPSDTLGQTGILFPLLFRAWLGYTISPTIRTWVCSIMGYPSTRV
jgi:hypothetical protein